MMGILEEEELTAKEKRQDEPTKIIPLSAPLRLLDHLGHQILVPKEPIVRSAPDSLLGYGLLTVTALLCTLILPLQRIRQVPAIGEPEPTVAKSVFDEGDEFFFDGVVEDGVCGGDGGEREETEVCCLVD